MTAPWRRASRIFIVVALSFAGLVLAQAPASAAVSINDVQVAEGESGSTDVVFTITRDDTSFVSDICWETADGTAQASDDDFVTAFGCFDFEVGQASEQIVINANGDTTSEADEIFYVNLESSLETFTDAQGAATILDDDGGGGTPVTGTPGPDTMTGTEGPDVFYGGGGDDVITGLGGDDLILGQDGNDQLFGGDGNDQLFGEGEGSGSGSGQAGFSNDIIEGGFGNDLLFGGIGNDTLNGEGSGSGSGSGQAHAVPERCPEQRRQGSPGRRRGQRQAPRPRRPEGSPQGRQGQGQGEDRQGPGQDAERREGNLAMRGQLRSRPLNSRFIS